MLMQKRPFITKESTHILEARCFGAAIQFLCEKVVEQPLTKEEKDKDKGSKDDTLGGLLQLFLVRPSEKGRIEIFNKQLDRRGGLIGLGALDLADLDPGGHLIKTVRRDYGGHRWHDVHLTAYAKSKKLFEGDGTGEQVFAGPGERSCMALLDDVTIAEPIIRGAAGLSMESSDGNYQHLYAFDRALDPRERGLIQRALVECAQAQGLGGDSRATDGSQPHRVPGSVNYKPGRGLFVCRLAATWMPFDGARHQRTEDWIKLGHGLASTGASDEAAARAKPSGLRRGPVRAGHASESEADWAWACAQVEEALGHEELHGLARRLELELSNRARPRRKGDADRYSKTTVKNLRAKYKF